jgi:hypothetical protein
VIEEVVNDDEQFHWMLHHHLAFDCSTVDIAQLEFHGQEFLYLSF